MKEYVNNMGHQTGLKGANKVGNGTNCQKPSYFSRIESFISGISPAIRKSLGPIVGYSEFIKKITYDKPTNLRKINSCVDKIATSATQIYEVTENQSSLTQKIGSDNWQRANLRSIIKKCIVVLDGELKYENINLYFEDDNKDFSIHGNEDLLEIAVYYILYNSISSFRQILKKKDKYIKIKIKRSQNKFKVVFDDNATGRLIENGVFILKPFYATKVDSFDNMLRLSLIEELVESQNGKILLSINISRGTTIEMSFPIT